MSRVWCVINFTARTCQELALQASLRRILGASWEGSFGGVWRAAAPCSTIICRSSEECTFCSGHICRIWESDTSMWSFSSRIRVSWPKSLTTVVTSGRTWALLARFVLQGSWVVQLRKLLLHYASPRIYGGWAFVAWWLATLECALLHGPEQNRDLASFRLYTLLT